MNKIFEQIHDNSVYIVVVLSIILGFIYLNKRKNELGVNSFIVFIVSLLHAVFFLLSCKILVYIEYGIVNRFSNLPEFVIDGGYSFFGNIYIMPIFYSILALILKKDIKKILDIGTPAILISAFCARINCFISGCCLGIEIYNTGLRFPTRLIELLCYTGIFIYILYKQRKNKLILGTAFPIYLIVYGCIRMLEEPFRAQFITDKIHFAFIHCSIAIIFGTILYVYLKTKKKKIQS